MSMLTNPGGKTMAKFSFSLLIDGGTLDDDDSIDYLLQHLGQCAWRNRR